MPPPDLDPLWMAYQAGDVPSCLRLARAAVAAAPRRGDTWFALACACERAGDFREADRAFARAHRAPEEPIPLPWRVSWGGFQAAVQAACEALPPRLREAFDEVTLVLADYADPAQLAGFDAPELLGLFTGPLREDLGQAAEISPSIHLFRRAHEHACSDREEFRDEVRRTLFHEFGHYLGYDEDGLEALGLA